MSDSVTERYAVGLHSILVELDQLFRSLATDAIGVVWCSNPADMNVHVASFMRQCVLGMVVDLQYIEIAFRQCATGFIPAESCPLWTTSHLQAFVASIDPSDWQPHFARSHDSERSLYPDGPLEFFDLYMWFIDLNTRFSSSTHSLWTFVRGSLVPPSHSLIKFTSTMRRILACLCRTRVSITRFVRIACCDSFSFLEIEPTCVSTHSHILDELERTTSFSTRQLVAVCVCTACRSSRDTNAVVSRRQNDPYVACSCGCSF